VLTFTDITALRAAQAQAQAQAALRESMTQRRLAVVVYDSHDAITVQDQEGRTLAWNPAAERIYGWSEAEALTMNIRDRIQEKQREEEFTRVQQLARADVLEPYRTERLAKDGRIVHVWLTATALVNETDEMYAVATTEREAVKSYGKE
jgi:two-component system CheB/CheR fusion protein